MNNIPPAVGVFLAFVLDCLDLRVVYRIHP